MTLDIEQTLRSAVTELENERTKLDGKISLIKTLLDVEDGAVVVDQNGAGQNGAAPRKRVMSPAERKAVSLRMKRYWKKRHQAA